MQASTTHNRPDKNLQEESKASGWNRSFSKQRSLPPDEFINLDELAGSLLVEHERQSDAYKHQGHPKPPFDGRLEDAAPERANPADTDEAYNYADLSEVIGPPPVENPQRQRTYGHTDLEEVRADEEQQEIEERRRHIEDETDISQTGKTRRINVLQLRKHLLVTSYLVLGSQLGTLSRLGLQALTVYPRAPVAFPELWANMGGCLILGFLSEDRTFFRKEWEAAMSEVRQRTRRDGCSQCNEGNDRIGVREITEASKTHRTTKATIPLFIGLSVGFCGSFTSFSSFIRDAFLTLSDNLDNDAYMNSKPAASPRYSRNPGGSVMGVLAIVIVEVGVCISALQFGAHVAIVLQPVMSKLPRMNARRILDPLVVLVAWAFWIAAGLLAIWTPDQLLSSMALPKCSTPSREIWRGELFFALAFAPLGCLIRFHASLRLNGLIARFPLGTFMVNLTGTIVLGACWNLQHASLTKGMIGGGLVGCQILDGIQDGFCGCVTTVSTWVLELKGLERRHAYIYGAASVGLSISALVVIMGTLIWTDSARETSSRR